MKHIADRAFHECKVKDVYYAGSEAQWNEVDLDEWNFLSSSFVHINCGPETEHVRTSVVTKPGTCTTWGEETVTCTCGASRTEYLDYDPGNHTEPDANGNCSRCGKHLKDVEPTEENNSPKLNFFQRIIQWLKTLFAKLFRR